MLFTLLVVLGAEWGCAGTARAGLRVYKGHPDQHNEFPFVVMLQPKDPPVIPCTGSLISQTWILTAAHCLLNVTNKIVRFGDFSSPPNETKLYANVVRAFMPTQTRTWNANFGVNLDPLRDDIGLLLVEKILKKPTVKLLALDYRSLVGLPVTFAGLGHEGQSADMHSYDVKGKQPSLNVGAGVLVPCYNFKDMGVVVCVESKCSNRVQGARPGDSGGPLIYDGRIIGVVKGPSSWTLRGKVGSSFTPVSIYLDWITRIMNSNR